MKALMILIATLTTQAAFAKQIACSVNAEGQTPGHYDRTISSGLYDLENGGVQVLHAVGDKTIYVTRNDRGQIGVATAKKSGSVYTALELATGDGSWIVLLSTRLGLSIACSEVPTK